MTELTQYVLPCSEAYDLGISGGARDRCDAAGIPRDQCTAIAGIGLAGEVAWVSHAHQDIDPAGRVNPALSVHHPEA
ncbi:hypothetical protein [Frankia sp. AvcI1]|uniref:hypothetical protein n=1 Tax=Frankia sp. AvcI1 TaxID=573496 RepID=UPI002117A66E|nr:hypothetical protein [Frankia sp. AvcI1]